MALLSGTPGEPLQDPQPPSCPTTGGEDASGDRLSPLFPLDSSKIESNSGKIASSEELPHTDMKLGHDVCMVDKKFVEGGDSRQVFHTFDGAHNPFNLASLKQKEPSKEVDEVEEDWNRIPESILSSLVQAHNQLFGSENLVIPDGFTCTQMLTTHISLDDATNLLLASVGVQLVSKFQLIWLCWANVPPGIIGMPLLMERLVIM